MAVMRAAANSACPNQRTPQRYDASHPSRESRRCTGCGEPERATVRFFDAASDQHLGTSTVLAEPHELCFDPTQRLLWCANTYHPVLQRRTPVVAPNSTVIDPDTRGRRGGHGPSAGNWLRTA